MMAAANIPLTIRYKIWKEAAKTAALLDSLMTVEINSVVKSHFQHAFGFNPNFAAHLRTFGEAGTVKTKTLGTPKLANRGVACMFIGYPPNHKGDCYQMWNPVTNGVHTTRDVIWLKRMFYNKEMGQSILINPELLPDVEEEDTTSPPTGEGDASDDDTSVDETVAANNVTVETLDNLD
jgi:hypothetical protein